MTGFDTKISNASVSVVIVAAGGSVRVGFNKLTALLPNGKTVLENAVTPFCDIKNIRQIVIAVPAGSVGVYEREFRDKIDGNVELITVAGGLTRTESVKNALERVTSDYVLIHDGARPYVKPSLILRVLEATVKGDIAIPAIPVTDSLITDGCPVNRETLKAVQTPQGFKTAMLKDAYLSAKGQFTDDATVFYNRYGFTYTVDGDPENRKITYPHDLGQRTGAGYDLHRLTEGDGITLGGVKIPCEFSTVAHSDGDALIHAVMDAALTALGKPDIGYYFPDTDEAYEGICSLDLLAQVVKLLADEGWHIANVSAEVIAQKPKLAVYVPKMIDKLANALNLPTHCVGIAATTNEGVGVIGEAKAMAAFACVLISR